MKNVILLLMPALLILGCGPGPREKLYPVKGIVTVDGAPLPTGTVTFHPVAGAAAGSRVIVGLIEAEGVYVEQTDGEVGVPAGEYVATVHASLASDSTKPPRIWSRPTSGIRPSRD